MFMVCMVTVVWDVIHVITMQPHFVSTRVHSVTLQRRVGFVATAMTKGHFTVFLMDSAGC
jgi:hypothetical protein